MAPPNFGKRFGCYLGLPFLDFVIYFVLGPSGVRNFIFIFFGIVKAYYIVGAFMHLKYEKINLALVILVPTIFIFGLIAGLLHEGNAISQMK
jgi:Predicted small integral membrane protein